MTTTPSITPARAATRLLIFAKAPQPGQAKTRLIPALGAAGAAALAQRLLLHTLAQAVAAQAMSATLQAQQAPALVACIDAVELCTSPALSHPDWQGHLLPAGVQHSEQGEGDLGARLARASARALQRSAAVLLIGTDCPALDAATLCHAAQQLAQHDAVVIPANDGGYCLLGFKQHQASLFTDMPWSTAVVAQQTLARCATLGWRVWQGVPLTDIDEPADLAALPVNW